MLMLLQEQGAEEGDNNIEPAKTLSQNMFYCVALLVSWGSVNCVNPQTKFATTSQNRVLNSELKTQKDHCVFRAHIWQRIEIELLGQLLTSCCLYVTRTFVSCLQMYARTCTASM